MKRTTLLLLVLAVGFNCKKEPPVVPPNGGPDTTSHQFSFVLDTLGDGNSSVLNDVFIISESNVWAVGEVYLRDSTGQIDPTRYNLAQWDGAAWRFLRVLFPVCNSSGQEIGTFPFAATSIFAFAANDVWIASLGTVVRWNGQVFQRICLPPGSAQGSFKKIWGHAGKLYLVGTNGNITYFSGTNWQRLESGTTVDIQDIYGAVDGRTGETEILAVASLQNYGRGLEILTFNGSAVTRLDTTGLRLAQSSLWFAPGGKHYVAGDGLFWKEDLGTGRWSLDTTQPNIFKRRIRGNAANDVFVVGDFGLVSHYNGATWRQYGGREIPHFFGSLVSVAVFGDRMIAVGEISNKAIVLRGQRP
ncbi:MAG: hypothetical protein KF749_12010 [Bacteroidetes bacterium]|nr:hypothetical protein [Bacteroidota bacterium]MCW5894229.1 hypothetical protein [Bacteroidota bacterium]